MRQVLGALFVTTAEDNEAFRLEFVGRMSAVLGIEAPEPPRPVLRTRSVLPRPPMATASASNNLIAAVTSAKLEIDQLKHIIDRYQRLAGEISANANVKAERPSPAPRAQLQGIRR